jgi:hypothetical protein
VLKAALDLLAAAEGPLLADFEAESQPSGIQAEPAQAAWGCPVNFAPAVADAGEKEKLISAFGYEVAQLRPWYDLRLEKSGRTTVSDFEPAAASELLSGYLLGGPPQIPDADLPLAVALRLAAHDIKAFYFEAATARPGADPPESGEFDRWFWNDTAAARILKAVKQKCLQAPDKALRMTAALLIPLQRT